MKKQIRKLSLRSETVRQLDKCELVAAGGAVLTTFTLRTCVDCPSIHVTCNTTPNGGVQ